MYSQERRMERYRIMYTWKINQGLVPNCGLEFTDRESRRGLEVVIQKLKSSPAVQSLREQSFQVHGGRLLMHSQETSEI